MHARADTNTNTIILTEDERSERNGYSSPKKRLMVSPSAYRSTYVVVLLLSLSPRSCFGSESRASSWVLPAVFGAAWHLLTNTTLQTDTLFVVETLPRGFFGSKLNPSNIASFAHIFKSPPPNSTITIIPSEFHIFWELARPRKQDFEVVLVRNPPCTNVSGRLLQSHLEAINMQAPRDRRQGQGAAQKTSLSSLGFAGRLSLHSTPHPTTARASGRLSHGTGGFFQGSQGGKEGDEMIRVSTEILPSTGYRFPITDSSMRTKTVKERAQNVPKPPLGRGM
ncbi:hypothetical protein PAAG_04672 [Paracoccidioides lutzii Pb01]|uniref:Uncharacterized protein n=1 Tax=Paracoccidioides lutzii (strain ATCC MYA-826 / Pb01) TaxID=502779 RepID=C1H242_PARBA|nr:hypothetical protein PAAG_04672 [Paracoccidioides lutzii Pb01]EEH33622.2 hypothetical protein PAAG_04672 [Paracoccidioides lutzii Pb01]